MKFGILPFFLIAVLLIAGAGFAWLALTDMPVHQMEMSIDMPVAK